MVPEENDYIDVNDPNYPRTQLHSMSEQDCQAVIDIANFSPGRPDDLPSCCIQWLLKGDIFTRRRYDLEETMENSPTIMEIKQERRVAIVVIDDRAQACDEAKFEAYDPDRHPDIDSINIFHTTPAEAVKLLQTAEAYSQSDGSANKLENVRKAGASKGIKNTAHIPSVA